MNASNIFSNYTHLFIFTSPTYKPESVWDWWKEQKKQNWPYMDLCGKSKGQIPFKIIPTITSKLECNWLSAEELDFTITHNY